MLTMLASFFKCYCSTTFVQKFVIVMQERAGLQASTSGRAAVPALKHRHARSLCAHGCLLHETPSTFRGLLLRHHRVVRHAKRSGDDGQSFNPKDMEELKNLMPDPQQDSLFDDRTCGK